MSNNNSSEKGKKRSMIPYDNSDSEHDYGVHKNLRRHKGKPSYDPKSKTYLKEP